MNPPLALFDLAELRRSFDAPFARPAETHAAGVDKLLAIRVGTISYALRLTEISGLARHCGLVRLPSPAPHLLGIKALEGALVPVFDLASILGLSISSNSINPTNSADPAKPENTAKSADELRWLFTCYGTSTPVALAFADLEGYVDAEHEAASDAPDAPQLLAARAAHEKNGGLHWILNIPAVLQSIGFAPRKN